jgi:hypothetical protein
MRLSGLRVLCLASAAVLFVAGVKPSHAQSQSAMYEDMMRVYQATLSNPNLDPATRARLQNMMNQVQQSYQNMQSLGPQPNYGYSGNSNNYAAPNGSNDSSSSQNANDNPYCPVGSAACPGN